MGRQIAEDIAPASTALSTDVWTNQLASALANGAAALAALRGPTVSGQNPIAWDVPYAAYGALQASICGGVASGQWATLTDVVNVNGSGVLNFVAFAAQSNYAPNFKCFEVLIDGASICQMNYVAPMLAVAVGVLSSASGSFLAGLDQIPFHSSLVIRAMTGSDNQGRVVYKYRRTS